MNRTTILTSLNAAFGEDLCEKGDVTSDAILQDEYVEFSINARENLILCGIPVIKELLDMYPSKINYTTHKNDGDVVKADEAILSGKALAVKLFAIERIILNFIQHLSGIASLTHQFVQKIQGTNAKIRDTRKTTPGLRLLEKYAVEIGGGGSYRKSLSDKILIKDNHIASCGSAKIAIQRVRSKSPNEFIAIECDSIVQVKESLAEEVGLIMLDNMSITEMKEAMNLKSGEVKMEASGGITLANILDIASLGVDYISVGAITHSASNKDIGLDLLYYKNNS